MTMITRAVELFSNQGLSGIVSGVRRYIQNHWLRPIKNILDCLNLGEFRIAFILMVENIIGQKRYREYVTRKVDGNHKISTNGYDMIVDTADPGLSSELLAYGVREIHSTNKFESELKKLKSQVDGKVTVLEIGMNIGYYGLLEAKTLGDKGHIHAFEVSPSNIELAKKNIELNGFKNHITLHHLAVGEESGTTQVELTKKSNRNHIKSGFREVIPDETYDSIKIDKISIDDFLKNKNIKPDEINVVRMDVQGYEWRILQGMESVLQTNSPLLMFIETHPYFIDEEKQQIVIDQLKKANLELIHSSNNFSSMNVKSVEDLIGVSAEVILRR